MSRVRIFQSGCSFGEALRVVDPEITHKIKTVLRMSPGEDVFVFDGKGRESSYTIETVTRGEVLLKKGTIQRNEAAPGVNVALAVPLLKEGKMEFLLQKVCELGVVRILPYIPARGNMRKVPQDSKLKRWRKIVAEAIRQSERLWCPVIEEIKDFSEIISRDADIKIAAHPSGGMLEDIVPKGKMETVFLIVGPEGDFSPGELQALSEQGFARISLSDGVLRTETAAICVSGLISYFYQL